MLAQKPSGLDGLRLVSTQLPEGIRSTKSSKNRCRISNMGNHRLANKSLTSNATATSSTRPPPTASRPHLGPHLFDPAASRNPWQGDDLRKGTLFREATKFDGDMASEMRNMNINEPVPDKFLDPWLGPLPPAGRSNYWQGTNAPTENSHQASQAINAKHCIRTQRTVADFRKGQIVTVPTHVPNLDPKKGPGIVEYALRGNVGTSTEWINHGLYDHVNVEVYDKEKLMLDTSTIKLTGGRGIDPQEDISIVGRLTEDSYNHVETLWEGLSHEARSKSC
ncbi:hypothetical protein AC579_5985 [Pseudocercospora musae]|uniref:Uncharacterized protein n=1 Tax=Pseudocercospora musae TaxID=113226 RepID=A0A139I4H3_9PEZI|nr:hypothetical protein AC579_5985 [Pseudocercospora musae]